MRKLPITFFGNGECEVGTRNSFSTATTEPGTPQRPATPGQRHPTAQGAVAPCESLLSAVTCRVSWPGAVAWILGTVLCAGKEHGDDQATNAGAATALSTRDYYKHVIIKNT